MIATRSAGAGATLAFAVGLPALADKFPQTFGGENGLVINPPMPPASLGVHVPTELDQRSGELVLVSHNLPLAIYGVVLIIAMLVWPSGIQGALRALARRIRRPPTRPPAAADPAEVAS